MGLSTENFLSIRKTHFVMVNFRNGMATNRKQRKLTSVDEEPQTNKHSGRSFVIALGTNCIGVVPV